MPSLQALHKCFFFVLLCFLLFVHFASVRVLLTASNGLFCSCVDDCSTWPRIYSRPFNTVKLTINTNQVKCWFFEERGLTRVPVENLTKLNPHMGIEPGLHWWKASALTTASSLHQFRFQNWTPRVALFQQNCILSAMEKKRVSFFLLQTFLSLKRVSRAPNVSFPLHSSKRRNDQNQEGHTIMSAKSGKSTSPVSINARLLKCFERSQRPSH